MKKLIIFCTVLFGFIALTSMVADTPAEFKFTEESHDFGKIPKDKPVTIDFKFTNVGDEPLIISAVTPQCGCTVAKFTATPVKKGESGTVTLTFNAAIAGTFTKTTTVTSNAKTPTKYLYFKGEVEAPASPATTGTH